MFRNNEPTLGDSRKDGKMNRRGSSELPTQADKWKDWKGGAGRYFL